MAKHKKTKKQKLIADLRRQLQTQKAPTLTPQTSNINDNKSPQASNLGYNYSASFTQVAVKKSSYEMLYPFVLNDLRKTTIITFIILLGYMLIYLLFNNHFLA